MSSWAKSTVTLRGNLLAQKAIFNNVCLPERSRVLDTVRLSGVEAARRSNAFHSVHMHFDRRAAQCDIVITWLLKH